MTTAARPAGPLVSVIVPVHDGAPFLSAAIDSALAQDYRPIELIVVDDGSADDSASIARRYPDVRVSRQDHRGVSAARNAGVALATGSLIAFLDADDTWLPGKLARQVELMNQRPDVGWCVTLHRCVLEAGASPPAWLRPDLLERDHVAYLPSAVVVRARVMAEVGPFDPSRRVGEDSDWFFRARDLGIEMAVVGECLLLKRVHAGNLTRHVALSKRELLDVVHRSLQRRRGVAGSGQDAR
jgi:glycosyltransferase involved in cell wall biosynthesis